MRALALRVHYRLRDERGGPGDDMYELASRFTTLRYLATEIPHIVPPSGIQPLPVPRPAAEDHLTPHSPSVEELLGNS